MARTPWKMYLLAWNLAGRCFSEFCEMVKKFEFWAQNLNWKKFWTEKNFWKKNFFGSEHVSSQIWCQKIFPFSWGGGGVGVGVPKKKSCSKWAETHFGFGIFEIRSFSGGGGVRKVNGATSKQASKQADRQTSGHHSDQISRAVSYRQTSGHHSDQISRSALRDGATKNSSLNYLSFIINWLLLQ